MKTEDSTLLYWQRVKLILSTSCCSAQKLVLLSVSDHQGRNSHSMAGIARHAQRTSLSARTVQRTLQQLVQQELLQAQVRPGRPTWHSLQIEALQALAGTPATVSPLTHSHPCHSVTPDTVTQAPDTVAQAPDTVTQAPATVTPKGIDKGIDKGVIEGEKTRRRSKALTRAQAAALPLPEGLPEGYAEAWQDYARVRPGSGWHKEAQQVHRFHQKLLKAHQQGKDVVKGLQDAYQGPWKGINPAWLDMLPAAPAPAAAPAPEGAVLDFEDRAAAYRAQLLKGLQ